MARWSRLQHRKNPTRSARTIRSLRCSTRPKRSCGPPVRTSLPIWKKNASHRRRRTEVSVVSSVARGKITSGSIQPGPHHDVGGHDRRAQASQHLDGATLPSWELEEWRYSPIADLDFDRYAVAADAAPLSDDELAALRQRFPTPNLCCDPAMACWCTPKARSSPEAGDSDVRLDGERRSVLAYERTVCRCSRCGLRSKPAA